MDYRPDTIILYIKSKKGNIAIQLIDIIILIFLVLHPLIQHFTLPHPPSLFDILKNYCYFGVYICTRIIFVSVRNQSKLWFSIYTSSLIILIIQFVLSYLQYFDILDSFHSLSKITGFFFNPGPFSIYITAIFLLNGVSALKTFPLKTVRINIIGNFAILTPIFYETSSRATWVALLIVIILFLGKEKISTLPYKARYLSILYISILVIFFCLYIYSLRPASALGRITIWRSSLEIIKSNFINGIGLDNFPSQYMYYQAQFLSTVLHKPPLQDIIQEVIYPFNIVLGIQAEMGIIGTTLFFMILHIALFSNTANKEKHYNHSSYVGLFIVFAGLFSYPLQVIPISILFWIVIAISISTTHENVMLPNKLPCIKKAQVISFLILNVILCLYICKEYTNAYIDWNKIRQTNTLTYRNNILFDNNPEFLYDVASIHFSQTRYQKSVETYKLALTHSCSKQYFYKLGEAYEKLHNFKSAIRTYQKVKEILPGLIKPRYLLAKAYLINGDYLQFETEALELKNFKEKINSAQATQMKKEIEFLYETEILKKPVVHFK